SSSCQLGLTRRSESSNPLGSRISGSPLSRRESMVRDLGARPRAVLVGVVIVAALSLLALVLPSAGRAIVNIEGQTPEALPDYDSRASVAPSADALAAAKTVGADVTWNRFGVAGSVSNQGNYVTKGLQAPDAVTAARNWLATNKALFG